MDPLNLTSTPTPAMVMLAVALMPIVRLGKVRLIVGEVKLTRPPEHGEVRPGDRDSELTRGHGATEQHLPDHWHGRRSAQGEVGVVEREVNINRREPGHDGQARSGRQPEPATADLAAQ